MRIGVDVGGTHTDAVILAGASVVATSKRATSRDVSGGIIAALEDLLGASGTAPTAVEAVMIGTTHFTNAFVERRRLLPVAVIRAARPACDGLPPLSGWPGGLAKILGGHRYSVRGGYEFDGREISPLNEGEILGVARDLRDRGLRSAAISSTFSPVNPRMEERIAEILLDQVPGLQVTLSSRVGGLGLLERENAAIMNASLAGLASEVVDSLERALQALDLRAPLYISQNDGTLMNTAVARRYPVRTFASGPTNSMRGAALLAGTTPAREAIVVDLGGTTCDIGMLKNGYPRESALATTAGGVRSNQRMADLVVLGLGGGSRVRQAGTPLVGPDSVGYRLRQEALVFGGDTLTATDIAVAAGLADLGDRSRVAHLAPAFVRVAGDEIRRRIEEGIDRIKTEGRDLPVILVGGGSILLGEADLAGASEVIRPPHFSVANAVGAAVGQFGGAVDRVFFYGEIGRDEALATASAQARAAAARAGADEDRTEVIEISEIPLTYMPGGAVRLRVRAVGEGTFTGRQRGEGELGVGGEACA